MHHDPFYQLQYLLSIRTRKKKSNSYTRVKELDRVCSAFIFYLRLLRLSLTLINIDNN